MTGIQKEHTRKRNAQAIQQTGRKREDKAVAMDNHDKAFDLGSALESIGIEIETLTKLLCLYLEYREDEIGRVDPEQPWTTHLALNRANLGLALLNAIEAKTCSIAEDIKKAEEEAYSLSQI